MVGGVNSLPLISNGTLFFYNGKDYYYFTLTSGARQSIHKLYQILWRVMFKLMSYWGLFFKKPYNRI